MPDRAMTVGELREFLEGFDADLPVLAEYDSGLWLPVQRPEGAGYELNGESVAMLGLGD